VWRVKLESQKDRMSHSLGKKDRFEFFAATKGVGARVLTRKRAAARVPQGVPRANNGCKSRCFAAGDSRLYTALLNLWATLTLSYLYN